MNKKTVHAGSFRDPSGFVFKKGKDIFRQINPIYFDNYKKLIGSGLYENLVEKALLVPHNEISRDNDKIIIQPEKINFIVYPYEWSFLQLKDAALLTLKIQREALKKGMTLKDATAFNVTFNKGRPVFIDTLSFERYIEGKPWKAYGQFCSFFVAPLVMCKYVGPDSTTLLARYIDGLPLDFVCAALPLRSRLKPLALFHIHMLAKYQKKYLGRFAASREAGVSKAKLLAILDGLYEGIRTLSPNLTTEWEDYYSITNYDESSFQEKKRLVYDLIEDSGATTIWDVGGNDGTFSRGALENTRVNFAYVSDVDGNAVNSNYAMIREHGEKNLLPFVADFANPSPGIGFDNRERESLTSRLKNADIDLILALAFIHHITLTNNISFDMSAAYFANISRKLIIEFPDVDDSWVDKLLSSKREFRGHFSFYGIENFEKEYSKYFTLKCKRPIKGTRRTIFFWERS